MNEVSANTLDVRIVLADSRAEHAELVLRDLATLGLSDAYHCPIDSGFLPAVERHAPNIVVLAFPQGQDFPELLESVAVLSDLKPLPIMLFARGRKQSFVDRALNKGVTTFVAEDVAAARIVDRIGVVNAQFERMVSLQHRLASAEIKLSEEKIISRAKALLIEHQKLTEHQAHLSLRKYSMKENRKLVDVASGVIASLSERRA